MNGNTVRGRADAGNLDPRVQELRNLYGGKDAGVADLLCDRHPAQATAYTIVDEHMRQQVLTYGDLRQASERFAAALSALGVGPGDRVATLLGKSAELLVTLLGIWRVGAVHVPLFTAFAPPAIGMRLQESAAKVVVCDRGQRSKLAPHSGFPEDPDRRIVVVGDPEKLEDLAFAELLQRHEPGFAAAALGGDAPFIQIYTSGTTGRPKGVVVPILALASFHAYMEFGLDLRRDDVFWNAADPGWAYGLYFGVIGSLALGVPSVLLTGGFSAQRTIAVLDQLGVTNFAAAPTVYRSLRADDASAGVGRRLRCASAAGEPLTPEINEWARHALGVEVHDHYGQTEAGMVINNHHHPQLRRSVRAGSMGHPMPGWTMVVLRDDADEPAPLGTVGRIAFDLPASPLAWFSGYLREEEKTAAKFAGGGRWYLTGDVGRVDDDGYVHFLARDDDVIIMAGYRIGPFDVESVLATHSAVAEVAVIAAPDQLRGEVVEACVVLQEGWTETPELAAELKQWVKTEYAAHAYPRTVHFMSELPKTPSGKIQRAVLRERRRAELERIQPIPGT
ncbi:AMP-binding protein [Nocardia sp. NPDC059240]|uniref:AMP-binding protein n=1 Tax=Nocardia sp. NPDC059240 TaxID=3346786 RepID=UPI00367ED6C2